MEYRTWSFYLKEDKIQQQIISFLSAYAGKYNYIFFAPMNETANMILSMFKVPPKTVAMINSYMRKMGFLAGVSDIMILQNGKAYCIELKNEKGKQSKSQIRFEANCKKTGVPYGIARSLEDCQMLIKDWGIV